MDNRSDIKIEGKESNYWIISILTYTFILAFQFTFFWQKWFDVNVSIRQVVCLSLIFMGIGFVLNGYLKKMGLMCKLKNDDEIGDDTHNTTITSTTNYHDTIFVYMSGNFFLRFRKILNFMYGMWYGLNKKGLDEIGRRPDIGKSITRNRNSMQCIYLCNYYSLVTLIFTITLLTFLPCPPSFSLSIVS